MEIKELLEKYPFLEYRNVFSGELTAENEEDRLKYNWWTAWDNCGWEKIWKKYLSVLFEEYEKLSDEAKKNFMIMDTKEKYGSLRIDTSYGNDTIYEAEKIVNMISQWTCYRCGKMPRNSNGKRLIWETRGWILPLCKDCMKKKFIKDSSCKIINHKVKELKLVCRGFRIRRYDKNGKFIYAYKDLGDWLKLDKIIKVGD